MRSDVILGALAALSFTLGQGAMALGHCASIMPVEGHRAHKSMGHEEPDPDGPDHDGMKGCHACLRKRVLPIKG